jgi:hypothetical protein
MTIVPYTTERGIGAAYYILPPLQAVRQEKGEKGVELALFRGKSY